MSLGIENRMYLKGQTKILLIYYTTRFLLAMPVGKVNCVIANYYRVCLVNKDWLVYWGRRMGDY